MSLKLGTQDISGISQNTKYNAHHLLDFKWTDCIMNDVSWLRADTFSWQSGDVYTSAYNHLVQDLQGTTAETETIGSYTITFYRATDGHKICLADQETTVANIYSETGIAWYYILDTTNTQFKLPRTKFGFEGLRTNVGDRIDETLPYIGFANDTSVVSGNLQFGTTGNTRYLTTNNPKVMTGDSGIMSLNAPVQERATQMYLYFYVGDYSQTAIEQTAGLNSELFNGKADVDLSNVTDVANIKMAHNSMPSDKQVNLTLGASGTWYTAPADGWFYLNKTAGSDWHYCEFTGGVGVLPCWGSDYRTSTIKIWTPVKKGTQVQVRYNATGTTNYFYFVYAQGSESEAQ